MTWTTQPAPVLDEPDDLPCGESGCFCHCGDSHVCACDCPRCWDCGQHTGYCQCDNEED